MTRRQVMDAERGPGVEHPLARPGGFAVLAYRSGSGERPENTLCALRHARRHGAVPELDLRHTSDGVIVGLHEVELASTTDGTGRVDGLPYAAIRELDAGVRFEHGAPGERYTGSDTRIPTLDEILGHDGGPLMLDVKFDEPRMLRTLVETIERHGAQRRVCLTNELTTAHRRLTRLRPHWLYAAGPLAVRAQVYGERLRLDRILGRRGARIFIPERHGDMQVLTPRLLSTARALDQQLIIWIVDDAARAAELRDMGVAGIYTSRPEAMAQSIGSTLSPAQPAEALRCDAQV